MLRDIDWVKEQIIQGRNMFLAADEELLSHLPRGNWIAGTIPYFMNKDGGVTSKEQIYVQDVPEEVNSIDIQVYDKDNICKVASDAPENGFTMLIIPAFSALHTEYAENAIEYEEMFMKPILGWISGIHLDDMGEKSAKTMSGSSLELNSDKAVAMHCTLPEGKSANIGIINVFKQGDGDVLTFKETSFEVKECFVNGESVNFAEYVKSRHIDTKLPLVADYSGTMVNVSIQSVKDDEVDLYAPVFTDVEYKFAEPVKNYVDVFTGSIPHNTNPVFTCNCILNFLYSELEGKITKDYYGPITFGEIAYQLLNQTLVYLEIS